MDNKNQRVWWIDDFVTTNEEKQTLREKIIADYVVEMIKKYDVIALQEVSGSFIEILNANNSTQHPFFKVNLSRISYSDTPLRKIQNCNMIIHNCDKLKMIDQNVLFPAEYLYENNTTKMTYGATNWILFQHSRTSQRFYFSSVHLNYNSTANYVKMLLEMERKYPMFLAGDFNKGVRFPPNPPDKHIQIYSKDCFRFPSISHCYSFSFNLPRVHTFLPYSHVCPFCNVESEYKMLDRYDHIVYVLPNK